MDSHSKGGYVDDVPYTFHFARELSPAWLDFVVTLSGFEPPSREDGFAWCELGCGQGLTAAIYAATHPAGDFHGIDASVTHIEHARRLCDNAGITNLTLHATDFASATEADLSDFDYIVAHGVYTWVDAPVREDVLRFIDRRLKPGGVVFLSYNSMPGWANDAGFQFLIRELSRTVAGNSSEQFFGAMQMIEALTEAGAPALVSSYMATGGVAQLRAQLPNNYFAHEFLPSSWQPLYVTQVRADMARVGLSPAGSATIRENFDSFVLSPTARGALASIADPDLRELTRDFFLNQRFRRDVFIRGGRRIDDEERDRRLSHTTFDLQRPFEMVEYGMDTQAGRVEFGNPSARAIVDALRKGLRRLTDVARDDASRADVLAAALALYSANEIRPVDATLVDVARLNTALRDHVGDAHAMRFVALPSGTAVAVSPELTVERREGEEVPPERARWWDFIDRYRIH